MSSDGGLVCEFPFDDVMDRVKEALGASSYNEVAVALGLTSSAFANRKKAGSIPWESIVKLGLTRGWDLQWVFRGKRQGAASLDPKLLADILEDVHVAFARHGVAHSVRAEGMFAAMIYGDAVRLSQETEKQREIAAASADLIAKTIAHKE